MTAFISRAKTFSLRFVDKFFRDNTTTLAASLAYFATLSIAPLMILFLTLSSGINPLMQQEFVGQVQSVIGVRAAEAIQIIIQTAKDRPDLSRLSGFFGALTLAVSASAVFSELKSSLNIVFETTALEKDKPQENILWQFLKLRILSVGFVLSFIFIFILLVSLVASSFISVFLPGSDQILARVFSWIFSFAIESLIFCLIYRYIPDERILWREALQAGTITAALFVSGKEVVGIYLGNSGVASAYGAAGSVIVLLIWIYYSALIVFSGAQLNFLMTQKRKNHEAFAR